MTKITQGTHGPYHWLECPVDARETGRPVRLLIQSCPDVVVDKYVLITSFDGGSLHPTERQVDVGWKKHGRLAVSPKLSDAANVPYQWFDEWLIFEEPTIPNDVEVFVNYGYVSLGDPNPTIRTLYVGADRKEETELAAAAGPARERLWAQLERIKPLSYLSNGNCFIFVTRDDELYQRALAALR